MGRTAAGVTGMRFKYDGDFLQAIEVCDPAARLLVAREDGIGKRTPFEDYRLTRRGGTGVIAIDLPEDGSVNVAGALGVRDTDEVMLLTAKGQSIRTRVKEDPRNRSWCQRCAPGDPRGGRQAAQHRAHRRKRGGAVGRRRGGCRCAAGELRRASRVFG